MWLLLLSATYDRWCKPGDDARVAPVPAPPPGARGAGRRVARDYFSRLAMYIDVRSTTVSGSPPCIAANGITTVPVVVTGADGPKQLDAVHAPCAGSTATLMAWLKFTPEGDRARARLRDR